MVVCRCLYDSFVVRWQFILWLFLLQGLDAGYWMLDTGYLMLDKTMEFFFIRQDLLDGQDLFFSLSAS